MRRGAGPPGAGPAGPGRDPFAAMDVPWTPVSSRLVTARRVLAAAVGGPIVVGALAIAVVTSPPAVSGLVGVVGVAAIGWAWVVAGRTARSWRYAERAEDLLIAHGVLVRRLVIVPYGRMQLVDVAAGPVDRLFRVARVQLHTAAATTDAHIPGVDPPEATRLRNRLTERGETKAAGL